MAQTDNQDTDIYRNDLPNLGPAIATRAAEFAALLCRFDATGGLLGEISQGHRYFGFTRGEHSGQSGIWYREWAPGAHALSLIGDFNSWSRGRHPLRRDEYGTWSLFLPHAEAPSHGSMVKVDVVGADGSMMDRIPAYAQRVIQDGAGDFTCQVWLPENYPWQHPRPGARNGAGLRIYEAHVGMAQEHGRVGSFAEFEANVLPRIERLGYNALQLMAIQEHPYYGSFGYHVSSYFAVSSRFGTPEEFKSLVDAAHARGIRVLLDVVHSHAVKNVREGLGRFDGTDHQYFHSGSRGQHPGWDSLVFDYGKYEVQRFLLSNVRFWLEEFHLDGFRFDGVTSMLYLDHGLGRTFGYMDDYFGGNIDRDALAYLELSNELVHRLVPEAVTVAEDVSGMPAIARPTSVGGIGFDYRLAMGIPDFWIKTLKERSDEGWSPGEIWSVLTNRRFSEKHIAYSESHDQALVGDKTLAFRLMDAAMYTDMSQTGRSIRIDRGLSLLKLMRLMTFSIGGEGWLSFMGNEFGHPEWIDFPREGNNWSYHHARRQWSLVDDGLLYYKDLNAFDEALMDLDQQRHILEAGPPRLLSIHEDGKRLVYSRGDAVFAVNMHASDSYAYLHIPIPNLREYAVTLSTDDPAFAGLGRATSGTHFPAQNQPWDGQPQSLQIYLPNRSALVLMPL